MLAEFAAKSAPLNLALLALVLWVVFFFALVIWVFLRRNKTKYQHLAQLPLNHEGSEQEG